jgi:hypothetical protein
MPKEIKDITDNVMDQIHNHKLKMRPRIYFMIGSIFTFAGLIASVVLSIFFIGLTQFSLRTHGPMGQYRLNQILSDFPWWAPIFAAIGLVAGIWLLRRYDFSYKINFKIIIIASILAIVVGVWIVEVTGLGDTLICKGPMQGIMSQYLQDNNIQKSPGQCRNLVK